MLEAIDIAPAFVQSVKAMEREFPLGINYSVASATQIPFKMTVSTLLHRLCA